MKTPNKAFTLIELVMVIVVLGILAAISLPKFYTTFKKRAIEKSEDYVIGVLSTAIKTKQCYTAIDGTESYPCYDGSELFALLEKAPPYIQIGTTTSDLTINPDGIRWRYRWAGEWTSWHILCPHWNGSSVWGQGQAATKGRRYNYCYGANYPQYGHLPTVHKPGDVWVLDNLGH